MRIRARVRMTSTTTATTVQLSLTVTTNSLSPTVTPNSPPHSPFCPTYGASRHSIFALQHKYDRQEIAGQVTNPRLHGVWEIAF